MEEATEMFAAVLLLVIGLSHMAQPCAWVEFYVWLRGKGRPGAFVNGFLCLGFGSFIVAFHNLWTWPAIILTLFGWAQVLKGFVNFVIPEVALWGLHRVSFERSWHFIVAGAFTVAVSAALWYHLLMT